MFKESVADLTLPALERPLLLLLAIKLTATYPPMVPVQRECYGACTESLDSAGYGAIHEGWG